MKYKVVDLHSDYQEELIGTCELCYSTAYVENGYVTLEDANGKQHNIYLTTWFFSDFATIEIDNVINFSAWLQTKDVPEIEVDFGWNWLAKLVNEYTIEQKGLSK